jgi:hypothetical protein
MSLLLLAPGNISGVEEKTRCLVVEYRAPQHPSENLEASISARPISTAPSARPIIESGRDHAPDQGESPMETTHRLSLWIERILAIAIISIIANGVNQCLVEAGSVFAV